MKTVRIFAIIFILYGLFMLAFPFFGETIMTLWQHLFTALACIFGGVAVWHSTRKIESASKYGNDSKEITEHKEMQLVSLSMVGLAILMWVISIGDKTARFDRISILCGIVIFVGIGMYFLMRYLLKKTLNKKP